MINISLSVVAFLIFKWAFLRVLLPIHEDNDAHHPIRNSSPAPIQCQLIISSLGAMAPEH